MVSHTSFLGRALGWIDLVRIWRLVNLAIGLGVLYKRRTGPIATTLVGLCVLFAAVVAATLTALSGD